MKKTEGLPVNSILEMRYRIDGVLGRGGFGFTYEAWDLQKNRVCAIKEYFPRRICSRDSTTGRLVPGAGYREQFLYGAKKFEEEAKVLRGLSDVMGVVRVWDYFLWNSSVFLVMERMKKPDLRRLIQERGYPFSLEEAVPMTVQIAKTLHKLHQKYHIIHHDISPDNLMFSDDGQLKLLDFGSARELSNRLSGEYVEFKPGFAPPEQYSDRVLQGAYTDVYALAAVFYFMVTGNVIPESLDRKNKDEYISLSYCLPGCPDHISKTVDWALALNVNDRLQTAEQFSDGLQGKFDNWEYDNKILQRSLQNKKSAYIKIWGGNLDGYDWQMPGDQDIILGRSEGYSNIALGKEYDTVSRQHCILRYDTKTGQFWVKDISSNGIWVSEKRLQNGILYSLKPGTYLVLAEGECMVEIGVR